jgi:hypothetical protein
MSNPTFLRGAAAVLRRMKSPALTAEINAELETLAREFEQWADDLEHMPRANGESIVS